MASKIQTLLFVSLALVVNTLPRDLADMQLSCECNGRCKQVERPAAMAESWSGTEPRGVQIDLVQVAWVSVISKEPEVQISCIFTFVMKDKSAAWTSQTVAEQTLLLGFEFVQIAT